MAHIDKPIHYAIAGITTEQFAIVEENFSKDDADVEISTTLKFGVIANNQQLVIGSNFILQIDNKPFLVIEGHVLFKIAPDDWESFKSQGDGKYHFNNEFATHLAAIAIGTTRGILHAKTEGTKFNQFYIPSINMAELIRGDVIIAEEPE